MRILAITSVFLSAVLAFSVEPLTAKRFLPAFGGTASVWVTCLVAFQGLLLLGYLYAHGLTRLPRKAQIGVHLAALAISFVVFPWRDPAPLPAGTAPLGWLLVELARSSGLPFFVLSTNTTLVQHWYSKRTGEEPWYLYAVSNLGSFVGLLSYPLVIEPVTGLHAQARWWMVGFGVFALITAANVVLAAAAATDAKPVSAPPPRAQVARWFGRSALGAMLLTAASFWITMDVAALPLLWVLPLSIYLVTFIIAFSPRVAFPRNTLVVLGTFPVMIGLLNTISHTHDVKLLLGSALSAVFLGCWIVHGDLARDRPAPDRLTAYYLWIAAGGFAGGLLGNVVPPILFDSIAEYPLALALLAIAFAVEKDFSALRDTLRMRSTWAILGVIAALLGFAVWGIASETGDSAWFNLVVIAALIPGVILLRKRPGLFGLASACVALLLVTGNLTGNQLAASRSFYGVARVVTIGGLARMKHGTTLHGVGRRKPEDPPGAYYHPELPLGSRMLAHPAGSRIGIVGLGTGALAANARPGDHITFYEINPDVEPLASEYFDYLKLSKGKVDHVLGDARLTVGDVPDGTFDVLIIDAFSSDAIPVHLLTEEGMAVWLRKIKPTGEVVLHISNRYFWLMPVVKGAVAKRPDVKGYWIDFAPNEKQTKELATYMIAAALTTDSAAAASLASSGWTSWEGEPPVVWTDDHTSVLTALDRERKNAIKTAED